MPAKATFETTGTPSSPNPSPVKTGEGDSDGNVTASLSPHLPRSAGGSRGEGSNPQPRKKRKGLKPRHIPQRTCIVTRQTGDKRGLIRIVRTPEGRVEVDATGKKNGRGAYLTADRAIWERALKGNALARALKCDINPEDAATLQAYAETLPVSNEQ
jgi:predicted RNA-binding protein YlxR (DUF448 family)